MTTRREALVRARKRLGLSQAAVAERVGITQQHYSAIELGLRKPALDVALRIAQVLRADPVRLFGDVLEHGNTSEASA